MEHEEGVEFLPANSIERLVAFREFAGSRGHELGWLGMAGLSLGLKNLVLGAGCLGEAVSGRHI